MEKKLVLGILHRRGHKNFEDFHAAEEEEGYHTGYHSNVSQDLSEIAAHNKSNVF